MTSRSLVKESFFLKLSSQEVGSEIWIQKNLLAETHGFDLFYKVSHRFAIITDDYVKTLWGEDVKKKLKQRGFDAYLFSVPPGEKSKTRAYKDILENQMLAKRLGRDTAIVALGGGVISDLAGFVAATYCRGIPFISIPTTLIGQVDASIGGKVGVNTAEGKNLIGAFHHPRLVLIDPAVLSTLPQKEWLNGMAEVIKYALIASKGLYSKLEQGSSWEAYLLESCYIKKEIVEKDPFERGWRRILNFGHTVGHAIETLTDYQMSHGEAVGLGMLAESYLSYRLGYLEKAEFWSIHRLLERYPFSLRLPSTIHLEDFMRVLSLDKKSLSRQPRFVLLDGIGKIRECGGSYCTSVASNLLLEMLEWLHSR